MNQKRSIAAAAAIALIAIAAAALLIRPGWYLVIRDVETGETIARSQVREGDQFAVGFIHSVNMNPYVDVYQIGDDHLIYAEETIYYFFGAGVQTELNEGETMTFGEDGAIIVGNIHKAFEKINYSIGMYSDDTLMLGDIHPVYSELKDRIGVFTDEEVQVGDVRVISLSALCGRRSLVSFTCEFSLTGLF